MTENESIGLAISLVGDSGVGKTSLLNRYLNSSFDDVPQTVSYNVISQKLAHNGRTVYIDYLDLSGDPYYETGCNQVMKQSQCVIVVVDYTKKIENLSYWFKRAKEHLRTANVPFFIAINKFDYLDLLTEEFIKGVEGFADAHSISVFKVSAKTGSNVDALFSFAQKKVIHIATSSQKNSVCLNSNKHSQKIENRPKSSSCC